MKNSLMLCGVIAIYFWAGVAHAAVIYQNDFSSAPTFLTDDVASYRWNEDTETFAMRLIMGPRTIANRFVGFDTPLDPTRSFTLTWRQNVTAASSSVEIPFGMLPEGLVGASSTPNIYGGYIQTSIGVYNSNATYHAIDMFTVNGHDDSQSGYGSFSFGFNKWYTLSQAYNADNGRMTTTMVDEATGTTIFETYRGGGPNGARFGPEMHYIGSSVHAAARNGSPAANVSSEYYTDVQIDDIRLEQEVVTPPETATLTLAQSEPSFGIPGTSFTLRALYTDPDNRAPLTAQVVVGSSTYNLVRSESATTTLGDGDYQNGELFTHTLSLSARGATPVQFLFTAQSGTLATSSEPVRIGYSNVAFLPGIQSSYLYRPGLVGDNQLWLPNVGVGTDSDIEDLFMNADGTSVRSDIYARDRDIITKAYGVVNVYSGFPEHMDTMVASGTIRAWKPIAYDWRLSFEHLLTHGAATTDGKIDYTQSGEYIIDELRALASSSDNGRVTIVAHSNGGLLAKALLLKLEETQDPLLAQIDTVMFVAVPHLGTPKALLPTLHGAENTLKTFSLDDATWRGAAKNSPGALGLMPSQTYLVKTQGVNIISFDASLDALRETIRLRDEMGYVGDGLDTVVDYRTRYGNEIGSFSELQEFLRGEGRTTPLFTDVVHPETLETGLLVDAAHMHARLDAWQPADIDKNGEPDIRVVEVVGTGLGTISGLRYITAPHLPACASACSVRVPVQAVQAVPEYSSRGDGTVMVQSADHMQGETYYFDIHQYNRDRGAANDLIERNHSNIMSAVSVRSLVSQVLQQDAVISQYLELTPSAPRPLTVIEVHSPVALSVTDALGNRVGSTTSTIPGMTFETTIPNSGYDKVGQSSFVVLPTENAYTLHLDGYASGTFTMKVKRYEQDRLVASTTFTDVPTTNMLQGTAVVSATATSFALSLDTNGDGITDVVRKPDGVIVETPRTAIVEFRKVLLTTPMSKRLRDTLSVFALTTEQLIIGQKYTLARLSLGVMKQVLEKGVKSKDISRIDADMLIARINHMLVLLK
jgi:pimeloyl-ACP methyl ester carboxylesterase